MTHSDAETYFQADWLTPNVVNIQLHSLTEETTSIKKNFHKVITGMQAMNNLIAGLKSPDMWLLLRLP